MLTLQYSLPIINCVKSALAFVFGCLMSMAVIPIVIQEVKRWGLLDTPDERKAHTNPTPTLGGIGIFAGILVGLFAATYTWINTNAFQELPYLLVSIIMLLAIGIMDDLHDFSAKRKFLFQIAAAIIVAWGGIRLEGLYGLFGIFQLPIFAQYTLTVFLLVGITNAVNLIDGINGLAGGLGFINAIIFGLLFAISENMSYAILAFALAGSLIGFLRYNFGRAKIFMGDTGSLVIGFLQGILGIKLILLNNLAWHGASIPNVTIVVSALFLIPVCDTLRVFGQRMLNGKSPFKADRTHIHHILIDLGLDHKKASMTLYAWAFTLNVVAFGFAFTEFFSPTLAFILLVITPIFLTKWVENMMKKFTLSKESFANIANSSANFKSSMK